MKNSKHIGGYLIVLCIILSSFISCEKDDICPESTLTTPMAIIRFYDINNKQNIKKVNKLRVVGVGKNTPITTFTDRSSIDSIALPLRVFANSTAFSFIVNSADNTSAQETGNTDVISLDYTTNTKFISKGCGYASTFILKKDTGVNTTSGTDGIGWIKEIEIQDFNIDNQQNAHVKVYH